MIWMYEHRHPGPELMDNPNVNSDALALNLKELERINAALGGHKTTFVGLAQLGLEMGNTYSLLDIGCGGGDTIAAIYKWGKQQGIKFNITGLDQSETAIAFARKTCKDVPDLCFLKMPFQALVQDSKQFDIITCSLFTHHLYGEDLKSLLKLMETKSRIGFVINDLQRHKLAWLGITTLTTLFSRSHLVKHDAPLSVKRGFTALEWYSHLESCNITGARVHPTWAFRHSIYKQHGL